MVYQFDRPSWFQSIYTDEALKDSCGLNSANKHWLQIYNSFLHANHSPDLSTKCGMVKPVLINPWNKNTAKYSPTDKISHQNNSIPNIVHFISFGSIEFSFLNYISFLSVHRFIAPWFIYIHGDSIPHGYWWNKTLQDIPGIHIVSRARPLRVQGYKLPWIEHSSDILRLQTIHGRLTVELDD